VSSGDRPAAIKEWKQQHRQLHLNIKKPGVDIPGVYQAQEMQQVEANE
jgi:hypothetical protein